MNRSEVWYYSSSCVYLFLSFWTANNAACVCLSWLLRKMVPIGRLASSIWCNWHHCPTRWWLWWKTKSTAFVIRMAIDRFALAKLCPWTRPIVRDWWLLIFDIRQYCNVIEIFFCRVCGRCSRRWLGHFQRKLRFSVDWCAICTRGRLSESVSIKNVLFHSKFHWFPYAGGARRNRWNHTRRYQNRGHCRTSRRSQTGILHIRIRVLCPARFDFRGPNGVHRAATVRQWASTRGSCRRGRCELGARVRYGRCAWDTHANLVYRIPFSEVVQESLRRPYIHSAIDAAAQTWCGQKVWRTIGECGRLAKHVGM